LALIPNTAKKKEGRERENMKKKEGRKTGRKDGRREVRKERGR
jgi:hypothetical protein